MAPTRRPGTSPTLSVELSPAYELLQSLNVVTSDDEDHTYEVGEAWINEARERAGEDLLRRAREVSLDDGDTFVNLAGLVYDTPAPRDVPSFIEHLRQTDPDEIRLHVIQFYAREMRRMTPPAVIRAAVAGDPEARAEFLRTSYPEWEHWTDYLRRALDVDGPVFRDELIAVLSEWNERVWQPESLTIMPILERDADAKRDLQRDLPVDQFITTATNGV